MVAVRTDLSKEEFVLFKLKMDEYNISRYQLSKQYILRGLKEDWGVEKFQKVSQKQASIGNLQKKMNNILSAGNYSHSNELKTLSQMRVHNAPPEEILAVRTIYEAKRQAAGALVKEILEQYDALALEPLTSDKYNWERTMNALYNPKAVELERAYNQIQKARK